MKRLRTGVMGATGLVGQHFVKILDNHPYFELVSLTASKKSAGTTYAKATDWFLNGGIPDHTADIVISETCIGSILKNDVDVVFSALPGNVTGDIEFSLAEEDIHIFSNAINHRMDADVPILIPEINPDHLNLVRNQINGKGGFIVTNSNCSTAGIALGLKPLQQYGIRAVFVTTYQAVSGAGRRGVSSIDVLGNVIPFIKNEETKIEDETRKILGEIKGNRIESAGFYINASCARVPVIKGHLASIAVELEEDITVLEAENSFRTFTGEPQALQLPSAPREPIVVTENPDRPQPAIDLQSPCIDELQGMSITVGRIRKKNSFLNFFLLVDNLVRGAAGTAVLNAEYARAKNFLN
ncbi:MAG: aspartate-semialdehyde dehydrogenase [Candidatus Odinarchaeota archaeon]